MRLFRVLFGRYLEVFKRYFRGIQFLGVFWASRGRIWTKIGGNQAETFPDLPIQPRTLDVDRKTGKIAREIWKKTAEIFFIRDIFYSP